MIAVELMVIDVETSSERNAVEQLRHVFDRVDGDADAADFAFGERVVGVVAHLRGQVEGDAQAADALGEQIPVAAVRFGGGAEAGVLPHRPEPPAVHGRLDAAGVGELAGEAEFGGRIPTVEVAGIEEMASRAVASQARRSGWSHVRYAATHCSNRARSRSRTTRCSGQPIDTHRSRVYNADNGPALQLLQYAYTWLCLSRPSRDGCVGARLQRSRGGGEEVREWMTS